MNFKQNEKISQVNKQSLVIGVDIASEFHYARAFDWRGIELGKVFKFEDSREGFESFNNWIEVIKHKEKKTKVLVGAEPTGHYWFSLASYLKEQNIKIVLVNPFHVKRSKELDDNHPSKTDRKDPKTIAKLVIEGRYSVPYIPEGVYAELRVATVLRERIVKELNIIKNRVQKWLKIYFPEHKNVFAKFNAISSMIVLEKAALPKEVVLLDSEGINKLWREAKLRAVGIKRAKSLCEAAKNSIGCTEGIMAAKVELKLLLLDYKNKMCQHEEIMTVIEQLVFKIPHVEKLLKIKGVGILTVAGFFAEVGDITRFDSPKQIQKLAGLAIRENSSGKHKGQTTISKRGRRRLRCVLFRAVMPLVAKNEEFTQIHNYYTTRAKNPLKKKQSLVAISCKLIRLFWALATKGVDYNAEKFIQDIKRLENVTAA